MVIIETANDQSQVVQILNQIYHFYIARQWFSQQRNYFKSTCLRYIWNIILHFRTTISLTSKYKRSSSMINWNYFAWPFGCGFIPAVLRKVFSFSWLFSTWSSESDTYFSPTSTSALHDRFDYLFSGQVENRFALPGAVRSSDSVKSSEIGSESVKLLRINVYKFLEQRLLSGVIIDGLFEQYVASVGWPNRSLRSASWIISVMCIISYHCENFVNLITPINSLRQEALGCLYSDKRDLAMRSCISILVSVLNSRSVTIKNSFLGAYSLVFKFM